MRPTEVLALEAPARAARARPTLDTVFEGSCRRLVVQVYAVVGDLVEAEDLVQEAFVRATVAGRRFAHVDNPEAWLRTTALNLHRNRWRKLTNFKRLRPELVSEARPSPAEESHVAVVEAMRRLPDAQRQVVGLHYLADLPVADIAETLGVPEGTVKSRLTRGRQALAGLLAEEVDDAR